MNGDSSFDAALFGEAMLLLVADEAGPLENASVFHKRTAGAETNVAIGLARLGRHSRRTHCAPSLHRSPGSF